MVSSKAHDRYPRPGQRVAPYTLREFLMEPIPAEFREKLGGLELKLCDLDETVWDRLPAETICALAQVVVERISAYHVRRAFQTRHFPRPAEGTDLSALPLENRTRRCLVREGFDQRPGRWAITRSARSCRCGRLVRGAWSICSARWNRRGTAAASAGRAGGMRGLRRRRRRS